jgi:glycoside/pentoside/hexuronide:cation symporter, GPH family
MAVIPAGEVAADAAPRAEPPPPSLATKLAYGFGSVAYGVKDNGFGFFLLLFYGQVIGVDARLVGLAITLCLIFDALSDPIVGYWSDNLRSRWGRRHPFMYAAALPVAASYFLLWAPPEGWSDIALFWYLLVLAMFIRTAITFYEVPSSALLPELTSDYDQRASLMSFRYYFAWTGGNLMSVLMFVAIFPAFVTATISNGQFNRDAYELYGLIAAALIFAGVMISALGTHRRIPYLQPPPAKRRLTPRQVFKEVFETLANRSFAALFVATIFGAVAAGLSAALSFYLSIYFWGFSSAQIGILTMGVFLSAVIGAVMAPLATRAMGKKKGAMVIGMLAFLGAPAPIVLRLLGILPSPAEAEWVFWAYFTATVIDVGLIICFQTLAAAMIADLVEQAELKTGRRSEGIFFAANSFIRKMVSGIGVSAAAFVLAYAGIKTGATPAETSPEAIQRLGATYVPAILSLWLAMMAAIAFYRIDRGDHEENLRRLAARKGAS